jgi:hypothetical protein
MNRRHSDDNARRLLEGENDPEKRRHFRCPSGTELVLYRQEPNETVTVATLDELADYLSCFVGQSKRDGFSRHVNEKRNDFAAWAERVWGESELARRLRVFPTPGLMMAGIERFILTGECFSARELAWEVEHLAWEDGKGHPPTYGDDSPQERIMKLKAGLYVREAVDDVTSLRDGSEAQLDDKGPDENLSEYR